LLTDIGILLANRRHQFLDGCTVTQRPSLFDRVVRFLDLTANACHHLAHRLLIFVAQLTQFLFLFACKIQMLISTWWE
jgi:hypothetical protein